MPGAARTWRSILLALAVIAGAAAVVFIGVAAWAIRRHTSVQFLSADSAQAQFTAARARFAGQSPLLEIAARDGGFTPLVHRDPRAPRREVSVLHVLSYDARARKLVRADVPGWLLAWVSVRGSVRLANLELFNDDRDRLTLEDLERHGPGLVTEITGPPRVMIWTE